VTNTKPDEPAFPLALSRNTSNWEHGLTKREYFIAAAMQGLLARSCDMDYVAEIAVKVADHTLREANK
jgi:hypothetical protein